MEFGQEFIEYIVKSIVNKPEEVRTERKVDEQGVLITVFTANDDIGYVIGKSGKTAIAIRTLLATLGAKHNMRISFRIDAPDNGKRRGGEGEMSAAAPTSNGSSKAATVSLPDDMSVDSLTF